MNIQQPFEQEQELYRNNAIRRIEHDTIETNELVRSFRITVDQQQDQLDILDNHLSNGKNRVETAETELEEATQHQRSTRCRKIGFIFFLVLFVFAIFYTVFHNSM